MTQTDEQIVRQPLRLWPGVIAAALLCVLSTSSRSSCRTGRSSA